MGSTMIVWIGALSLMYFFPDTWVYHGLNFVLTIMIILNIFLKLDQIINGKGVVEFKINTPDINFVFILSCGLMGSLLSFGIFKLAEPYLFYTYIVFLMFTLWQLILLWEPKKVLTRQNNL